MAETAGLDTTLRCTTCDAHQVVTFSDCLRVGWPKCCGETMLLVATSADIEEAVGELLPDRCIVCGCTDEEACTGGCCWVAPGLCSSCVELGVRA